jgi:hypothetical protein
MLFYWQRLAPWKSYLLLLFSIWSFQSWAGNVEQAYAQASACQSSSNSGVYTVTVCITEPAIGATITGMQTVNATIDVIGTDPGMTELRFYLRDSSEIEDGIPPYTFVLPSTYYVDGLYSLAVEAVMKDGFVSSRANVSVRFQNGISSSPVNPHTFQPAVGSGDIMLAAVGDGAGYYPENPLVADLIVSKQPDFFLYLGDVYNVGSHSEFYNWYGPRGQWGYGRLADITNPTPGNHEYGTPGAADYFFYWNNVPHYYSYDSGGWHFISLDSNTPYNQLMPGTAQYDWLEQDLNFNTLSCVLVYFHHPRFSIGPQADNPSMDPIWKLLAQKGVDVVLTGHEHSYQRWHPLDINGSPDPQGMTQFVVGTGGNDNQTFRRTDARVAFATDSESHYGALFLKLFPGYLDFEFVDVSTQIIDTSQVTCSPLIEGLSAKFYLPTIWVR